MGYPKYEIFIGRNSQYYFRLRAENAEIILQSEGYTSKAGCHNGISSVRTNCPYDSNYKKRSNAQGQHYFVLVASNGEPIGCSEMYSSRQAMENGIQAVKRVGPTAPVEDTTLASAFAYR